MKTISREEAKAYGLPRYFTGIPCSRGHVSERQVSNHTCKECQKISTSNQPKERIKASKAKGYQKNKMAERERSLKAYHAKKNDPAFVERVKAYQNTEAFRESVRKSQQKRKKENPHQFAARGILHAVLIRTGHPKYASRTSACLGYDSAKLKERIAFNFKPGMSWENHGEWHIDHTKPIAEFVRQGITDPKVINCLSNLRPMWASENISKGGKWQSTKLLSRG